MRILQVIHQFPPFSSQGSEVYCLQLSKCLLAAGDDVAVFHISNTARRRPKRLEEVTHEGIRVFHCIDTAEYGRLADWENPFLRNTFAQVLRLFIPDVVHFHNFISLGDDLVGMAQSSAQAVVYHLHDYGLICPKAILLRDDNSLCLKNSPDFFEGCCPTLIRVNHGKRPMIRSKFPPLARWRLFAANQPSNLQRHGLKAAVGIAEKFLGTPETAFFDEKKSFFFAATRRIFTNVDRFIAPSAFLKERFVSCGLPAERILHIANGIQEINPSEPRPTPAPPLRKDARLQLGYIGAFHPHKGVHLLLEAFRGLDQQATLHLHGSSFQTPVSEAHFKRAMAEPMPGVVFHGSYKNNEIGRILANLDAVVIPSIWYENSPLTIQEAQLVGVPVITADVGGMAELVRDRVNGRLFRCNDSNDLRRVLINCIEQPEQLRTFREQAPDVPSIVDQSKKIRALYDEVI
jgi:glycosyltransferase involved in cell wall biosynthesis